MTRLLSFYVTSVSGIAIVECKACPAMDLVKRVAIDSLSNSTVLTKYSLLEIYGDVFTSIGEYKKPCHIEMDSSVPPVFRHCRKVPYASYDNLKQTLGDLEKSMGRKRFLRIPFGISLGSEVMQKRNEEGFSDIQGVNAIADDLIM